MKRMVSLIRFLYFMWSSDFTLSAATVGHTAYMRGLFGLLRIICGKAGHPKRYTTVTLGFGIVASNRI